MIRAGAAFVILTLAGLNGLLASVVETCTGNAPDSLMLFPITLVLNLIGMMLLCWKPHRMAAIAAGALPALLALSYSATAIKLASGMPACTVVSGNPGWEEVGEEGLLALGWGAAAAIFWIGLAYALVGGYRPANDRDDP